MHYMKRDGRDSGIENVMLHIDKPKNPIHNEAEIEKRTKTLTTSVTVER
jgi:hypothetical protein